MRGGLDPLREAVAVGRLGRRAGRGESGVGHSVPGGLSTKSLVLAVGVDTGSGEAGHRRERVYRRGLKDADGHALTTVAERSSGQLRSAPTRLKQKESRIESFTVPHPRLEGHRGAAGVPDDSDPRAPKTTPSPSSGVSETASQPEGETMNPPFESLPVEFDCTACPPRDRGVELLRRFDDLRPLQTLVLVSAEDPAALLRRLQEERPALFEWASLEAGPRWRIEIARRDAREGEPREITDAIEWDHDRLDRLERTACDAWGAGDSVAAEESFAMFAHGLRRHMGFEETLLFPEFDRRTGTAPGTGPAEALRAEHGLILGFVAAIESAVGRGVLPSPALLGQLQDALHAPPRPRGEGPLPGHRPLPHERPARRPHASRPALPPRVNLLEVS